MQRNSSYGHVTFTGYDDAFSFYGKETDQKKTSLLSKLFLGNDTRDGQITELGREQIKAVSPFTALDQTSGTAVLLHNQNTDGCHKTFLARESCEEVNGILDGTPTEDMKKIWHSKLTDFYAQEKMNILSALLATLETNQRNLRNANDTAILGIAREKTRISQKAININNEQRDRGWLSAIGASVSGKAREEARTLADIQSSIQQENEKIASTIQGMNEQNELLKQDHQIHTNKAQAQFKEQTSPENLNQELEQLATAFKITMLRYKKSDATAQAIPDGDTPDSHNDDTDFDMELSRTIDGLIEEAELNLDPYWTEIIQSMHITTQDEYLLSLEEEVHYGYKHEHTLNRGLDLEL